MEQEIASAGGDLEGKRVSPMDPTVIRAHTYSSLIRQKRLGPRNVVPANRFPYFAGVEECRSILYNHDDDDTAYEALLESLGPGEPSRKEHQDKLFYENLARELQEFNRNTPYPSSSRSSQLPSISEYRGNQSPEGLLQESSGNPPYVSPYQPYQIPFSTPKQEETPPSKPSPPTTPEHKETRSEPSPPTAPKREETPSESLCPKTAQDDTQLRENSPPTEESSNPLPIIIRTSASPQYVPHHALHWLTPTNISREHLMVPIQRSGSRARRIPTTDENLCQDHRCRIGRPHPPGLYLHSGQRPAVPDEWFGYSDPPPRVRRMMQRLIDSTHSDRDLRIVSDFLYLHGGDAVVDGYKLSEEEMEL